MRNKDKFIVCLTHDVDRVKKTYQYITKPLKCLLKKDLKGFFYHLKSIFLPNPYWNFEKILKMEELLGVKSTFFFLDESIKFKLFKPKTWKLSLGRYNLESSKIKKIIRLLDKNGWEVGLHGSYCSYKSLSLLKKEKDKLERVLGRAVVGIRQHYLNKGPFTWHIQEKAGLLYDSSFRYSNNEKINLIKTFSPLAHNPNFKVFPLVIMDSEIMFEKDVKGFYLKLIGLAKENNSVLVLNWHQRVFNEREFLNYLPLYREIILECKMKGAEFKLLRELLK